MDNFYIAYINNILIYSEDLLEYKLYIKKVLYWLREAGLQVDIKKNKFDIISTKFLRFIINIDGVAINLKKILVIRDWKPPILIRGI